MAPVDHTKRVVGTLKSGFLAYRLTGPPVGIVQFSARKRFGTAVIHVHRQDGGFGDGPGVVTAILLRRIEIDGDHHVVIDSALDIVISLADSEIHMPGGKMQTACPAPALIDKNTLIVDRQSQFLGQCCRHDYQGQAVPGALAERLSGIARLRGIVFHLELVLAIKRIDQPLLGTLGPQLLRDFDLQVALHGIADGKYIRRADALGWRREQRIAE